MNAGTLAKLESPADDPLESWARNEGAPPTLDVQETQQQIDGTPIQSGMAAGTVSDSTERVVIDGTEIRTESADGRATVATEWCADVTGSGLVVAGSTYNTAKEHPFPLDLITHNTGVSCYRLSVDTDALAAAWADDDALRDVWMLAESDGDESTVMRYGDAASPTDAGRANTGVGFKAAFSGTVFKGVVHSSGYVAVWRDIDAGGFLDFVAQEILPFSETVETEEPGMQAKLQRKALEGE